MEDDIFAQLANLVNNKPTYSNNLSSTESYSFGDSSSGTSLGYSEDEMFTPDDVVVPDIKPRKAQRDKNLIIVIDDDFSTLDLMKIYLQRDYEYVPFDNPKNAIFYLNSNIPDLIFIDCYLNVMKTKKVVEIIRTYKELVNIPIIYLAEPSEEAAISDKLPEGVKDIISRPIKRADLQRILDTWITEDSDNDSSSATIDHPVM